MDARGAFMMRRHGEVVQVIQAAPRGRRGIDFVDTYNLPKLASCTIRLYSEVVASSLAQFWCKKLQFLFYMWANHEEDDYIFGDAEVEASNAPEGLEVAWQKLPKAHPAWKRIEDIEAIWPRL